MDPTTTALIACAAWGTWMLLYHSGRLGLALLQPLRQSLREPRKDQPPVSILIPIQRLETDLEQTMTSVFSQEYPEFEVLICSNGKSEDTIAAIRSIARRFPQISTHFITATDQVALNPKVNNLAPAFAKTAHELILIKDSNVELLPGQLESLVEALGPGTGMTCAIPIAINPDGFAADIEQAFMTGHAATSVLAGVTLGLNIGYGKVMLFGKSDFNSVGGLSVISNTFGDDHALAKAFSGRGLKTVYARGEVYQTLSRKTLTEVWDRQLRWMVIRRDEAGIAFFAEPFFSGALAIGAGMVGASLFAVPWWGAALVMAAGWIVPEMLALAIRGWPVSWRYPLALLCRELLIWPLWAKAWITRGVQWDGHVHKLMDSSDRPAGESRS